MVFPTDKPAKGFLRRFREMVGEFGACEELELSGSLRIGAKKVRLSGPLAPIQIQLGGEDGKQLHLCPEVLLTADGGTRHSGAYLLEDPVGCNDQIGGFLRLETGDSLILGREDSLQKNLLNYPKEVEARHLKLKLTDKGLMLQDLRSSHGTCISLLPTAFVRARSVDRPRAKLQRLVQLLGGMIEPLPRIEARELIEGVIDQIENEQRQALDSNGRCGGVVTLSSKVAPIFLGDLHARIDNLLTILTRDGVLDGLESGSAALVILGDAVHPDVDTVAESMESSMLMMDLIFRLMLAFPGRVFYIRGNHDGFSDDISKNGVPQGILWEEALRNVRGSKYLQAMARFYEILPYVALSRNFIACHAGAPTCKVSRNMLINIREHPKLEREITRVRLRRPNSPSGYNAGDVRRLRRRLELDPKTPFIVGHTPLSPDDTLWLRAGGIPDHHVLFGAHPDLIGVIVLSGKRLMPLRFSTEPLTHLYNCIAAESPSAAKIE